MPCGRGSVSFVAPVLGVVFRASGMLGTNLVSIVFLKGGTG